MTSRLETSSDSASETEKTESQQFDEKSDVHIVNSGDQNAPDGVGEGASKEDEGMDPNLVTWDGPDDPHNPKNWSFFRKWSITLTLSAVGFMTIMTSNIIAPALNQIAHDLDMNPVESQMALSVYVLAIAFGPLFLGPLSEIYGRQPVLHAANLWFLIWNLVCGFANSKGLLIAARLLAGFGGSLDYAISIGVLGDCWGAEQRGFSVGLYNFIPLLGTVAGPILGGYVTQDISWRWLFWIITIAQGVVMLYSISSFKETHEATLLRRKALRLRKSTGNQDLYTKTDKDDAGRNVRSAVGRSLSRPLRLLTTHPIIQVISLIFAFNYGVLFLVISSFANLWTSRYHESVATSGLNYVAFVIGELTGAAVGALLTDKVWAILKRKYGGFTPEYRVPLMLPGAVVILTGLFIYGWSAQALTFWLVPEVGVAFLGCGLMLSSMSIDSYVIDAYPDHTNSANAAASFL
ncbi:hypothetical protein MMC25_003062, partial [Agyrium rufum]|nr:hypothetical protein [Agyrium rufum]